MSVNIKEINSLLKKLDKLNSKLYNLQEKDKITPDDLDNLYDEFSNPPKRASLKMSQVLKLHKLRHKGKWKKEDYLLVVEPQAYIKATKLTPKNYMFDEDNVYIENDNLVGIGYFHSGESGLAQSGDGGDSGDLWWLANKSLAIWINKNLKKGEKILKKYK
jgi:hypothetical protein